MNVGNNIKAVRTRCGISQARLADLCGWESPNRISNYETGFREPNLEDIKILANALNIAPATLAFDPNPVCGEFPEPKINGIPILEWNQAYRWPENKKELAESNNMDFLSNKFVFNPNCFALKIKNDSMLNNFKAPFFHKGTFIIIDPEKEHNPESFVVAKKEGGQELIFRLYVEEAGFKSLVPYNNQYEGITLTPDIKICGVVVAHLNILP